CKRVLPGLDPFEELVRLIEPVHTNFLTYNVLLILEVFLADIERAHAISFQPQAHLNAIAWQRFVIVGVIEIGVTVRIAAVGFDKLYVIKLLHVRRTLKHHVLKQVGKPCSAFGLNAKTNVVVDGNSNYWSIMVLRDYDFQTVREFVVDDGNVYWFRFES